MKKLLSAIGILFLSVVAYGNIIRAQIGIPFPGPGTVHSVALTFALIASGSVGSTGGGTVTSASVDTTGANFFVVMLSELRNINSVISDNKSGTWHQLSKCGTTAQNDGSLWYANITGGSGHTFTATVTAGFPSLAWAGFSGAASSSPLDGTNDVCAAVGSGTTATGGSLTPGAANYLFISGFSQSSGASSAVAVDSSMSLLTGQVAYSTSNHFGVALSYQIQTTATARNPQWSWTGNTVDSVSNAVFKHG